MLGHVLRSDENTAAHQALAYAVETLDCVGRRGAPQANLFTILKEDLKFRDLSFNNFEEFNSLRDIAHDRKRWQSLFRVQFTLLRSHLGESRVDIFRV